VVRALDDVSARELTVRRAAQTAKPALLGVAEVADLLGVHPSTLYRAIAAGRFPFPVIRLGGVLRVPRVHLDTLITGEGTMSGEQADRYSEADFCRLCGSPLKRRPRCSAARRSCSSTGSV
jgi:excisionase family DNA binding protein